MASYMMCSRSDNTVKKYFSSYKKWQSFCEQSGYNSAPALPIHVAIYLTNLLDSGVSDNVISSVIYAIKWVHDINGFVDPTNNAFVKHLHESAKRIRGTKSKPKDPISTEHLTELCGSYTDCKDLLVVRDLCMILTAYAGFLRYDELSMIRCTDITIHPHYFKIDISKCKTDQYRKGTSFRLFPMPRNL